MTFLVDQKFAVSRAEARCIGCSLLMHGIIHHVCDDHNFKDASLFFRFRKDDKTYQGDNADFRKTSQFAVRLHAWLHCLVPTIIGDRDFGIMTHRRCFVARSLVLWLVAQGLAPSQEAAIELCRNLQQHGFLKHVTKDVKFDDSFQYFHFVFDAIDSDPEFLGFYATVSGMFYSGHNFPARHGENGLEIIVTPGTRSQVVYEDVGLATAAAPSAPSVPPRTCPTTQPWYHKALSREDAVMLLTKAGCSDGLYLVRDFKLRRSDDAPSLVLSVVHHRDVFHIIIHGVRSMHDAHCSLRRASASMQDRALPLSMCC